MTREWRKRSFREDLCSGAAEFLQTMFARTVQTLGILLYLATKRDEVVRGGWGTTGMRRHIRMFHSNIGLDLGQ